MKRCVHCILPETVPGITFNKDGICSFCQSYQKPSYYGEEELFMIVDDAKKKKCKYDCIVPVSGGRDSTYILYIAKKVYNLNVLAINYDNEFAAPQVMTNLKSACDILKVDFLSVRSKRDYGKKIAKHSILGATEFGRFGECVGCSYGYRSVVYRAAIQHKVPLIFWGESKEEATNNIEETAFNYIRNHKLKYLKLLKFDFYKAEYYRLLQRLEFYVSWQNVIGRNSPVLKRNETKEIRIFDYVPWDRQNIKETITRELAWQKPENAVSTWKTDCVMIALVNFYYVKLYGCTKLCFGYCNMIKSGEMKRHEALLQEEISVANYEKDVSSLLEENIGLSKEETDKILEYPSRVKLSY